MSALHRPTHAGHTGSRILRQALAGLMAALGIAATTAAQADGGRQMPGNVPTAYTQECASCHVAYPPGLLPAGSWQRLMRGLDRHFGTDASLDAAQTQALALWLQRNAGSYKRVWEEPAQDRITRSAWFERKHREIEASVWKLPSVKTAANCTACHAGADRGDFDDARLTLPAGLDPRLRRPWND
jgi:Dihaem cytochrome c